LYRALQVEQAGLPVFCIYLWIFMDLKKLQPPLEGQLALLGFELVLLERSCEGRDENIRIYVDHLSQGRPVTLDDCAEIHQGLMAWMAVEYPSLRENFGIEISSPGVERPLVTQHHFQLFLGRLCKAQTRLPVSGPKNFKGWINAVSDSTVILEEDGFLKQVPLDLIQKARLAPFDEDGAPKPKHTVPTVNEPACAETSAAKEA
jgi:ribosome maturation factor RimP